MFKLIRKIIESIENAPTNFFFWMVSFSVLIAIRILIENWLANLQNRSGLYLFYEFTHTFLFFLISYLLILWLIIKFFPVDFKKASNILLYGFLIILTPPIIDYVISGGEGYWSFYKFDSLLGLIQRFFTFFGDRPDMGITYGVRVEVALATISLFIYGYIKSRKFLKTSVFALLSYLIFFLLGTFPSWITILVKGISKGFLKVTDVDVAQIFLTPATIFSREIPDIVSSLNIKMSIIYSIIIILLLESGCWWYNKQKTKCFVANARFPQIIYHDGLFFAGMALGTIYSDAFLEFNLFNSVGLLVLLSAIFFGWLASVVLNDFEDKEVDKITNLSRPLVTEKIFPEQYKMIGWILFAASILFSAIINFKIALLLIVYQAIAWLYSAWPLRLKRFAFISTFVSALASLMILFSGYILISPAQNLVGLPFPIVTLLVVGYTLSLPIKDFKDIEGDKKNGIYTIPVIFGEYWGKIVVGGGLFLSFILSVIVFNEFRLFWWALLFGAVSFWIIHSSGKNKKVSYRRLPWWIIGVVILYGLVLVKTVFL